MNSEVITNHQYLNKYLISSESTKLILGTIHPHKHENFQIPFFYGNEMTFWNIMSEAYPNLLKKPIDLNAILCFLKDNQLAISDTIKKCKRKNLSALDKDLIPLEYNYDLLSQIEHSNIQEIYFTSGFGKNNAFSIFYRDMLNQPITKEIKRNRKTILRKGIGNRGVKLSRDIQLTILYSPSGSANIGISRSLLYKKNKEQYKDCAKPVKQFRIDLYREQFDLGK